MKILILYLPLFVFLMIGACFSLLITNHRSLSKARFSPHVCYASTLSNEKLGRKSTAQKDGLDAEALKIFHGKNIRFQQLELHDLLIQSLQNNGYEISTQIQALSIPEIQNGEDVVIGAETGSGKTLAYLIPIINQLLMEELELKKSQKFLGPYDNDWSHIPDLEPYKNEEYPRAVILAPNKELCRQVTAVARDIAGDFKEYVPVENLIGASYSWPFHPKRPAPKILVCTPVMLASFHKNLALFANLKMLVLDEADMLLDGGYLKQLDFIMMALKRCERISQSAVDRYADAYDGKMWVPDRTQRILAAATLPTYGLKSVDAYIKKHFQGAKYISNTLMHKHHPRLQQNFVRISKKKEDKIEALIESLQHEEEEVTRVMVFVNTAAFAQEVHSLLIEKGFQCSSYHKETPLDQRERILNEFRVGDLPILICTDLASRGLDIPNVSHVIQLEFATNVVQHLHRIGRAARAGRAGKATAFYDEQSQDLVQSILGAGGNVLDKSFSRRRGFRKKIKKGIHHDVSPKGHL